MTTQTPERTANAQIASDVSRPAEQDGQEVEHSRPRRSHGWRTAASGRVLDEAKKRRLCAVHEAGHIMACVALHIRLTGAEIYEGGGHTTAEWQRKIENLLERGCGPNNEYAKEEANLARSVRDLITMCLAGQVAEDVCESLHLQDGNADDLRIAHRYAEIFGLDFDKEIERADRRAWHLIVLNKASVEAIASALEERGKLGAKEIREIIRRTKIECRERLQRDARRRDEAAVALCPVESSGGDPLAALEHARALLAQSQDLSEIKEIRDRAEALRQYARAAKYGRDTANRCAEIKLLAERRAGELLAATVQHGGDRKSESRSQAATLNAIGISKSQSSRWQKIAAIPSEHVDAYFEKVRAGDGDISTAGLQRYATQHGERERLDRRPNAARLASRIYAAVDEIADIRAVAEALARRDKIGIADMLRDLANEIDKIAERRYAEQIQHEGEVIARKKFDGLRVVPDMVRTHGKWKVRGEFADVPRYRRRRNRRRPHDGDSPGNSDRIAGDLGMTTDELLDALRR